MKKRILLSIVALIAMFAGFYAFAGTNKMYKVMRKETSIHTTPRDNSDQIKADKTLMSLQRGDTLYAGEDTEAFLVEHGESGYRMLPIVYHGVKGYCYSDAVMPVKAAPGDSIFPIVDEAPEEMAAFPKSLVKWNTWAMNLPVDPSSWLWIIMGSLGLGAVMLAVSAFWKPFQKAIIFVFPICLAVASVAEIIYLLAMDAHPLWFFMPSCVGWGYAILGFLGLGVFLGIQYLMFYAGWACIMDASENGFNALNKSIGSAPDIDGEWTNYLIGLPALLAVVSLVLVLVDAFTGNTWGLEFYFWIYLSLVAAALVGAGYLVSKGKIIGALAILVYYIAASVGLAVSLSILGLYLVILIIAVIVVVAVGGALIAGVGGALFGGERVTGYTSDGRKVTGTKDIYGNVKGDDGHTYRMK